jgi:tRNA G18 (ribose-2'-O)-methylase SpoU
MEREPYYAGVSLESLPPLERAPLHVVLDNLRSAYNVGSIFRTADACGVAHIHLCGMSAHPPHPKIEKTALGATAYVPWTYYERTQDCLHALRAEGLPVVAVEVHPRAHMYHCFSWPQPVAIIFGNEVHGISEKIVDACDAVVSIPMMGFKRSINVATAFGIVAYGILHQWQRL